MREEQSRGISISVCYAQEDTILWDKLRTHLAPLMRLKYINMFFDVEIQENRVWLKRYTNIFNYSSIVLLLISPDSIASHNFHKFLQKIVKKSSIHVIPVLLRPTDCEDSPINGLQMLPSGAKPLTTWQNLDEAFLDVVCGIRRVIASLLDGDFGPVRLFRTQTSKTLLQREETDDIIQFCEEGISFDPHNVIFYKLKIKMLLEGHYSN